MCVKLQINVTQTLTQGVVPCAHDWLHTELQLTPDLEQFHPSTTTGQQDDTSVPAVLSGESLLICFLTVSSQANPAADLNKCNTLLFTTGLPSTCCKMLSKGFAKAFLSCFLSACQRSLKSNL